MSLILTKAVIRDGRVEVEEPIDLPDGSEVTISLLSSVGPAGVDDEMSPEEIARILAAMDKMEPLALSDEERAAWEVERQARREWELHRSHHRQRPDGHSRS